MTDETKPAISLARLTARPAPDPDACMAASAIESASAHLADLLEALESLLTPDPS